MRYIILFILSLLTICTTCLQATYLPREIATYVDHSAWRHIQNAPMTSMDPISPDPEDAELQRLYALLNQNLGDEFLNQCENNPLAADFLLEMVHTYMIKHAFASSQNAYISWLNDKENAYREFLKSKYPDFSGVSPHLDTYVLFLDQEKDTKNSFPYAKDLLSMTNPEDAKLFANCTLKFVLKSLTLRATGPFLDIPACIWGHPLAMKEDTSIQPIL